MRFTEFLICCLVAVAFSGASIACSAADADGSLPKVGGKKTTTKDDTSDDTTDGTGSDPESTGDDRLPDSQSNPGPGTDGGTTPAGPDGDGDGVLDTDDCEPGLATVGTRLLDDTLTTDKALFTPGTGFAGGSWSYTAGGLRQNARVSDISDLDVFNKDAAIGNVSVEVRAASTEIADNINPLLRQMFITLGTTTTGGVLSAVGCGVEVVGGQAHTQKTSIVRLNGSPGAVGVQVLQRVDRAALNLNEEFGMKATLKDGTLTCEVTQAATTTATANVGTVTGSVGLLTRQTKALFKNAKICKLK